MFWDLFVTWPNNRAQQKRMLEMAITRHTLNTPTLDSHSVGPTPPPPPPQHEFHTRSFRPRGSVVCVQLATTGLCSLKSSKTSTTPRRWSTTQRHTHSISTTRTHSLTHSLIRRVFPLPPSRVSQKNPMTAIPLSELSLTFPVQSSALRLSSTSSPFAVTSPRSFTAFQQKFRLHVVLSEQSQLAALSTHNQPVHPLLAYDILSVTPTTDTLLHAACASSDIDVISLPCSSRLSFYLKLPSLHLAAQNGIVFELLYAKGIRESASRRHLFTTATALRRVRGGVKGGVVVASGAERAEELRGCYDVTSVVRLMGWQEQEARAAISSVCERVLWHGYTRRTTKAALRVTTLTVKRPRDEAQPDSEKDEKQTEPSDDAAEAVEAGVEAEAQQDEADTEKVEETTEGAITNPSKKRVKTST